MTNSKIESYEMLAHNIMKEISYTEHIILEKPYLGTVEDGGQRVYADELKRLVALTLTDYYSVDNIDAWHELRSVLRQQCEHGTDNIFKGYATLHFLREMEKCDSVK